MRVVGVDGCRGGWIAVAFDVDARAFSYRVHAGFLDLLAAYPDAAAVGIDIPIGLVECAPRLCDRAARSVLGHRRSSVFPAPEPRLIDARTYAEALARSRALTGCGISKQAFAIYPKVAEVNRAMTPALQERVVEVHPEVSFWALAGERPMAHPKRTPERYEERGALLADAFAVPMPCRDEARRLARPAKPDDVLDATVAAWTARRLAEGGAGRLPADPPMGSRGLRAEIVYERDAVDRRLARRVETAHPRRRQAAIPPVDVAVPRFCPRSSPH